MSRFSEHNILAEKIGLARDSSLSDEQKVASYAQQLGIPYDGSDQAIENVKDYMKNISDDMEAQKKMLEDMPDTIGDEIDRSLDRDLGSSDIDGDEETGEGDDSSTDGDEDSESGTDVDSEATEGASEESDSSEYSGDNGYDKDRIAEEAVDPTNQVNRDAGNPNPDGQAGEGGEGGPGGGPGGPGDDPGSNGYNPNGGPAGGAGGEDGPDTKGESVGGGSTGGAEDNGVSNGGGGQPLQFGKQNPAGGGPGGNGYGALNNGQQGNQQGYDNFSRNMQHQQRMNAGKAAEDGDFTGEGGSKYKNSSSNGHKNSTEAKKKKEGAAKNGESALPLAGGVGGALSKIGQGLKKGASKLAKKADEKAGDDGSTENKEKDSLQLGSLEGIISFLERKLLMFLMHNPMVVACLLAVVAIFFIILLCIGTGTIENGSGSGGRNRRSCSTSASTGTVNIAGNEVDLSSVQVELINCDGTKDSYTVLETVNFDKYVLGVALAEYGDVFDEGFKAQIIAARNFALTRSLGMCPNSPDDCFYGYNPESKKIRLRACEADQVYWDYSKTIYRQDRGSISLYSPEITSGTVWKNVLSDSAKSTAESMAAEVAGKVLKNKDGSVSQTGYKSSDQVQFGQLAQQGYGYEEILAQKYTDSDGFIGGTGSGGRVCKSGNIDYGNYVLSSDGHEILHTSLDSFLQSKGTSLEAFNQLIESNVNKNGYGTRAGTVAAAVTLLAELGNNYNVKVPYYWGGGHEGLTQYAKSSWGSSACHTYANSQSYDYCGLDCSGFVGWAIYNGGFDITWAKLAGDYQNLPGAKHVSLSGSAVLEPGDLLESNSHVVLVVGVDEAAGQYICAEASGNAQGVLFTRRPFNSSGYWGVDMTDYYANHARSK